MNHLTHGAMPGTPAPKTTTLHEHPDGFAIEYDNGCLIVSDETGPEVHMPIGQSGLIELGSKLIAIGMALDALATFHQMGGNA